MKRTFKMWEEEFDQHSNWEVMQNIYELGLRFLRFKLAPIYKMEAITEKSWNVESYFYNCNTDKDFFIPQFETRKTMLNKLTKGDFE